MKKNVGGYDRMVRFVVGPVLLVVGLAGLGGLLTLATGTIGVALAVAALLVGAVFIVTATVQRCPLNRALGIDTYEGGASAGGGADDAGPRSKAD